MRLGEGGGCSRIMVEVEVETVPAAMGGGDLGHGAVDHARLGWPRLDRHDAAPGEGLGRVGPADIDVMGPAVDPVDDQVVAVVELVGEPRATTRPTSRPALDSVGS